MVIATCPGVIYYLPLFVGAAALAYRLFAAIKNKRFRFLKTAYEFGSKQYKTGLTLEALLLIALLAGGIYLASPLACTPASANEPPNCVPREAVKAQPNFAKTSIHLCPEKPVSTKMKLGGE